jgi:DNA-binding MarR family transcriptional regulator
LLTNKRLVELGIDESRDLNLIHPHQDALHGRVANTVGEMSYTFAENLNKLISSVCGLSPSASHVILAIGIKPGSTIDELSRIRSLDHSSMVRAIGKLELKGLVSKKKNKTADARAVTVDLTPLGAQTLSEMLESRTQFLLWVISTLTKEELITLEEIYQKLKFNHNHIIRSK